MLVETAIGDAYGAGFEYVDPAIVAEHNDLSCYRQHPSHGLKPGQYTDDTQMSVAIAEHIVEGHPWTREALAERFVATFRRDMRPGYSRAFYAILCRVRTGAELLAQIDGKSTKNGAAMRAGPVGVFADVKKVLEYAAVQARVTHDSPEGVMSAQAAALATHYFLHVDDDPKKVGLFINAHVPGLDWTKPWTGKVGGTGHEAVLASLTAIAESKTLPEVLRRAVAFTGDVDTVAAIAMSAGSGCDAFWAAAEPYPEHLYWKLEAGRYGREYLEALNNRLLSVGK